MLGKPRDCRTAFVWGERKVDKTDLVRGTEAAVAVVDSIVVIAALTVDAVEAIAVGTGHHNLTVVAAEEVAETKWYFSRFRDNNLMI